MENEDKLIKAFFEDLKEQDRNIPIPEFPEVKVKSFPYWIPMGVAASLIIGAFLIFQRPEIPEPPADVIIISLQENEDHEQEFRIEEKAYIDIWESSTSSLLTEF
ncbi:MAG: hypothetical protein HWE15_02040 [Algoriphagus sp.]|uniref:hypothetical protein n=1 Tax=Algoriphagus sp. TaxID=1872435 RepID=UPI001838FAAB|nr:hypothetical protein [Algoriphagus sp.]NVJ85052.1 hypothetical protein [Algoriphagus sp.]